MAVSNSKQVVRNIDQAFITFYGKPEKAGALQDTILDNLFDGDRSRHRRVVAQELSLHISQWNRLKFGLVAIIEQELRAAAPKQARSTGKCLHSRIPNGLRTPERDFYLPILQAFHTLRTGMLLVEEVSRFTLDQIGDTFHKVDWEHLQVKTQEVRWHNTLCFARQDLIETGYLQPMRDKGIWEISEKGKRWFAENMANTVDMAR